MLTHEQLGLSAKEYAALLKVRAMLDTVPSEQIEDVLDSDYSREYYKKWQEAGSIPEDKPFLSKDTVQKLDGFGGFNMGQMCRAYNPGGENDRFHDYYDCGTVGCIAGWMGVYMWSTPPVVGVKYKIDRQLANRIADFVREFDEYPRKYLDPDNSRSGELSGATQLFYPRARNGAGINKLWYHITPAEAVKAIDNFLARGEPRWHEVLGEELPDSPEYTE